MLPFFLGLALALLPLCADAGPRDKEAPLLDKAIARSRAVERELHGLLGLSVLDLGTGTSFSLNGDEVFPVASTIKLAVLLELLRQADAGKLDLREPVTIRTGAVLGDDGLLSHFGDGTATLSLQDLGAAMVLLSENSATNLLIDRLGMASVNGTLRALGLRRTLLRRRMLDRAAAKKGLENVSTPDELARLLQLLYRGRALSPRGTQAALDLLRVAEKSGTLLSRGVPPTVKVLNKPGALDGVRSDCGVIEEPRRPYVLCVLATALHDDEEGEQAIVRLSRLWYEYFHTCATMSEYGRPLP